MSLWTQNFCSAASACSPRDVFVWHEERPGAAAAPRRATAPPPQGAESLNGRDVPTQPPSPANLGCGTCKYRPADHPALRGVGQLRALGDDYLPAGTVLSYTAQWGNNFLSWNDPNKIQSRIQDVLSNQWGVVIEQQFHTSSDVINFLEVWFHSAGSHHPRLWEFRDIKSVIDGELYKAGVTGFTSTIAVTKQPTTPTASVTLQQAQLNLADAIQRGDQPAIEQWTAVVKQLGGGGGSQSFTDFLSSNALWIALGIGGVILAKEVL